MLITTYMQGLGFLAKSFLAVSDPKITDLAWGKKVRGVFPDRLISKKCSFIWKFTRRTLKTEYFSSVFEVFDPLDFEIGVKKRARNADFQHTALLAEKMAFFWFCFLEKFVLATSDRKITDLAWGKKVRGVFPDRLISKKCSFIWKFTRRTLKTEYFSSVFDVFDPLRLQGGGIFSSETPPPYQTRAKTAF